MPMAQAQVSKVPTVSVITNRKERFEQAQAHAHERAHEQAQPISAAAAAACTLDHQPSFTDTAFEEGEP